MRVFSGDVTVRARAADVFALYVGAPGWKHWDPEIRASSLNGAFEAGSSGTIVPAGGPSMAIRLTRVVEDHAFDAEAQLLLCSVRFEYELAPRDEETIVTQRVVFTGPLSWLFARVIGRPIHRSMPFTLAALKRAVEAGPSTV